MATERSDFMLRNNLITGSRLSGQKLRKFNLDPWKMYDTHFLRRAAPLLSELSSKRFLEENKGVEHDPEPCLQNDAEEKIRKLRKDMAEEKEILADSRSMRRGLLHLGPVAILAGTVISDSGAGAALTLFAVVYSYAMVRFSIWSATKRLEKLEAELKTLENRERIIQP